MDLDRTSRLARTNLVIDLDRQREIELVVSKYIREQFSFAVVRLENKTDRLSFESKIISTLSHCKECGPSARWLGASSPKDKIRGSGLWLVNELYKVPLSTEDLDAFKSSERSYPRADPGLG